VRTCAIVYVHRFTSFEVFRMKEKDIPIDVLEVHDKITAFAWEPKVPVTCDAC
jgi:uncharacterized protein with WD repeat